jgi:hypothetical protein
MPGPTGEDTVSFISPTVHWHCVLLNIIYYNITYIEGHMAAPCTILTSWIPTSVLPFAQTAHHAMQGHVFASCEDLLNCVADNLALAQHMHYYNQGRVDHRFVVGDVVLVEEVHQQPADGAFNMSPPSNPNPFIIVAVLSEVSDYLQSTQNHTIFVLKHISDLKAALNEPGGDPNVIAAAAAGEGACCCCCCLLWFCFCLFIFVYILIVVLLLLQITLVVQKMYYYSSCSSTISCIPSSGNTSPNGTQYCGFCPPYKTA